MTNEHITSANCLRGLDTFGKFSVTFYKGDNYFDFLSALLHTKPFLKESILKGKNLHPPGANSFPYRIDPFSGNLDIILEQTPFQNNLDRTAASETVSLPL